jgi:magnesium chelatase subunit D
LLDDSLNDDEAPPSVLLERCAFRCDLSHVRALPDIAAATMLNMRPTGAPIAALNSEQRGSLAVTAAALGIDSLRPLLFAERCAYAHAALHRRDSVASEDLARAAELVLAPLARQWPAPPETEPETPPSDETPSTAEGQQQDSTNAADLTPQALADIMLAAAVAVIPPDLLDSADGAMRRGRALAAGRSGQRQRSNQRGRPLGSRPGLPGHGRRLALLDSLRAAAPWQTIRRAEAQRQGGNCAAGTVQLRPSDLHVRRFAERQESLTIFAVDASGSAAATRLAEAKGAVELMLAQAYVRRAQVALIAFRKDTSETLLPPTRSLTRAKRALGALPGGGGTPLASALVAARHLAETAQRRGQTPTIALLTDGKANIMLDGSASRSGAMAQAGDAARAIRTAGLASIVIDIAVRPRPEAAQLAESLQGRYLHLPLAGSSALAEAVMQAGSNSAL